MTEIQEYAPNLPSFARTSFADLANQATVIDTGTLEKDKNTLIGLPHVITRVTYRPCPPDQERGYVSVEAVVADADTLESAIRRGWIPGNFASVAALPYMPEERIVYNDGSTGIRRQLTTILHAQGYLNVGAVEDGSAFDRDWMEWETFTQSSEQNWQSEKVVIPDFSNIRPILITHGLRVSEYDMNGRDATTFYLS